MNILIDKLFNPKYYNGEEVQIGDQVYNAGPPLRTITAIFPPENEICIYYDMPDGAVEISPAALHHLPLDVDVVLVSRKKMNKTPSQKQQHSDEI